MVEVRKSETKNNETSHLAIFDFPLYFCWRAFENERILTRTFDTIKEGFTER